MQKPRIVAAGGLVTNPSGKLLLIFRRGYWDLPKGKLDEGETIEACALREVQEETGLAQVSLSTKLGLTYHEYFDKWSGQDVEKQTHWYAMTAPDGQHLVPQTEEDIEQIIWADQAQIDLCMQDTYPNIIQIMEKAGFYRPISSGGQS